MTTAPAPEAPGLPGPPQYAVSGQRYELLTAIVIRWFLLAVWLFTINYRSHLDAPLIILDSLGAALALLNGYVHWRVQRGGRLTRRHVYGLSAMDLTVITVGTGVTGGFQNDFYIFYYPALLGVGLIETRRRINFGVVTAVAVAYTLISIYVDEGIRTSNEDEKDLIVRIASMFATVVAANLITRFERIKRQEAVQAAEREYQRSLELQQKAQRAELAAVEERSRIAREIHDGIAQSIYMLNLSLETCADLAEQEPGPLRDRLKNLVPLAKQTLLETRQYIYDLKPLLAGERGLAAMAENQVKEFRTVAGIPATLEVQGDARPVSAAVAGGMYRVLQEAMANVLKHARAQAVRVILRFEPGRVALTIQDDGAGFESGSVTPGYGLDNIRHRASEMGGTCVIESAPGQGARVTVTAPLEEVRDASHSRDDRG